MKNENGIIIRFKRNIRKVGASVYVSLPPEILDALHLKINDAVFVELLGNNTLLIEKKSEVI